MKNSELIEQLQKLPLEMEVCIFDVTKNGNEADADEPCGEGIYEYFKVSLAEEGVTKPFIALEYITGEE